jgi:hypothetical protein
MTPKLKFISGAFTTIGLTLILLAVSGCGCGVAGQRCTTQWTYTQQAPNQWVVTQTQTYGP